MTGRPSGRFPGSTGWSPMMRRHRAKSQGKPWQEPPPSNSCENHANRALSDALEPKPIVNEKVHRSERACVVKSLGHGIAWSRTPRQHHSDPRANVARAGGREKRPRSNLKSHRPRTRGPSSKIAAESRPPPGPPRFFPAATCSTEIRAPSLPEGLPVVLEILQRPAPLLVGVVPRGPLRFTLQTLRRSDLPDLAAGRHERTSQRFDAADQSGGNSDQDQGRRFST